jgi:nitrogen fixation NifU-like protein
MLDLAQEQIFERYKHPRFAGPLPQATHKAEGSNPVCGDELIIEALVTDNIIQAAHHSTRACAICTAAADLLCERVQGRKLSEVTALTPTEVSDELAIQLSPVRLKCALLPLETLKLALLSN